MGREKSGEGGRRCRIDDVEANSNYGEELRVFIVRIDKDAANLNIRFCRSGLTWIESIWQISVMTKRILHFNHTYVIGPLEFDVEILISGVIAPNPFDYSKRSKVLEKDHRSVRCDGQIMTNNRREQ